MTEKRFEEVKVTRWIDGEDRVVTVNDKVLSKHEIVDLLVEYIEENNELQQQIKYLERKIDRERRATQKQFDKWDKQAQERIKELETENEWLKQSNKNLGKIAYPTQRYFNGDVE